MVLNIKELSEASTKIINAVDPTNVQIITDTLELVAENKCLSMNVTNGEYYVRISIPLTDDIQFRATVNATTFLRLISQITTETVELTTNESSLIIKGNGTYKLPLIYDGSELLRLPEITIDNETASFPISSDVLNSILAFNSKDVAKDTNSRPVQRMYYIDEQGAITFTSRACVNNFSLPKPIKLLLPDRIVKLFKLFKDGDVKFTLGHDAISEDIIQTKARFETDTMSLTAILDCDEALVSSVPVSAIRNRASNSYKYSISVNKNELIQAINRLLIFKSTQSLFSKFKFSDKYVSINDSKNDNVETVMYKNEVPDCSYEAMIDLLDIKTALENCVENVLTLGFGDGAAVVISRGKVQNVIPEVREN